MVSWIGSEVHGTCSRNSTMADYEVFGVGDILVCTDDSNQKVLKVGERYTVRGWESGRILIEEYKRYSFKAERFRYVRQPRIEDLKVGNVVKCVNDLGMSGLVEYGSFYHVVHVDDDSRQVYLKDLPDLPFCMNRFFKVFDVNPREFVRSQDDK